MSLEVADSMQNLVTVSYYRGHLKEAENFLRTQVTSYPYTLTNSKFCMFLTLLSDYYCFELSTFDHLTECDAAVTHQPIVASAPIIKLFTV
jgi:hypothetical protein